jgi:hypothetical protein
MAELDSFKWQPDQVMPSGSWKTWSGPATQDFLKQVNREAATITKEAQGPFTLMQENPANRAAFGLLDREVVFTREFFRSRKAQLNFRTNGEEKPVSFFGVRGETSGEMGACVRVLAYRPIDHSHAIQIQCKEADDTVILYLPPKPQDFTTACAWLRTWRKQSNPDNNRTNEWDDPILHRSDAISIPYIELESNADLTSRLTGLRYHGNTPWLITRAEQFTRLELHEKGARVRAEVSIEAEPFAGPPPVFPRQFIYDRPFFVFLWRDGAEWPYFGAWIGDDSALQKFE